MRTLVRGQRLQEPSASFSSSSVTSRPVHVSCQAKTVLHHAYHRNGQGQDDQVCQEVAGTQGDVTHVVGLAVRLICDGVGPAIMFIPSASECEPEKEGNRPQEHNQSNDA